ncbi:MAG: prenyltransferase/squalene oxidase repeat-containing protein [Chloroflexota bacterium]
MSWQLASFLVLGAVLIGGFAWYERSRPPSQVVALVAALAAMAIAGRIAFAAFPNVKPTTDIVVFAGYALGPAPGFAVGALTGLVSNFWFGQGPWTPWQMVGWGLCGVLGALLALGTRKAGRISLAALCGFAGIAYGLLLNFSLMATYGGELSLQRFAALEARAIPFDAAHAIGNVAFALIAGPAMVRMLVRFRRRFQWRTPAVATAMLLALLLPALLPAPARAEGVESAVTWLRSEQNSDGGFGASVGDPSSTAVTGWAMLGLAAAGHNPHDVVRNGHSPIDFLRSHLDEATSAGDLARTIVALEASGVDPRSFGHENLIAALRDRRGKNGSFQGWPATTAYSVVALRTAGATGGLDQTLSWLNKVQNGDGGWGDTATSASNVDVTAAVMQAIPETSAAEKGLEYLRRHQHSNGGFALGSGGGAVNSQSTGWAVQAMVAVGAAPGRIVSGGHSALDYLAAMQADDGHFRYSEASDQTPVWVTSEALVGAARESLPIWSSPRERKEPAQSKGEQSSSKTGGSSSSGGLNLPPSSSVSPGGASGGSAPSPSVPLPKGTVPAPGGSGTEGGELPPAGETQGTTAAFTDSEPGGGSPLIPIGIGLACTGLAIALPWLLGRRFDW